MKPIKDEESYFDSKYNCLGYAFDLAIKKIDEQHRYSFMEYKNVPSEVFHQLNYSVQKLQAAKIYFLNLYEKELERLNND